MEGTHYHVLPKSQKGAIGYVLDKVAKESVTFKEEHGFVPCLFIDGVDLLAKEDQAAFIALIDRAKHLSNSNTSRIVLVSSEGMVMPLFRTTSSISRATKVREVVDISDGKAVCFLLIHMPENTANAVAEITGGRFVHMLQALDIFASENKTNLDQMGILNPLTTANIKRELSEIAKYFH